MNVPDLDSPSLEVSADLHRWLTAAVAAGASDLHLIVGYPPVLRLHGDLQGLDEPALDQATAHRVLLSLCPEPLSAKLSENKNIDFSLDLEVAGRRQRFRANVFYTTGQLGGCLRVIPSTIPDFTWAGFP